MADNESHKIGLPLVLANPGGAIEPQVEKGVGSPSGVLTRPRGSLFLRTDVAGLWQNTDGATAWTLLATLDTSLGGDLSGTLPDPSVVGLQGYPIEPLAPANGDALLYNGLNARWEHAPIVFGGGPPVGPAGGDLGGLYPNPTVVGLYTNPVSAAAPSAGDALVWDGLAWTPTPATSTPAIHGSFSDSTNQPLTASAVTYVKFDTTESANGVSVQNDGLGNPTRLVVAQAGVYACTLSPQVVKGGAGGTYCDFWPVVDGTPVPRSASRFHLPNNEEILPYIEILLPLTAGQAVQWAFQTPGNNVVLTANTAAAPVPAGPSVIAGVKRLGA